MALGRRRFRVHGLSFSVQLQGCRVVQLRLQVSDSAVGRILPESPLRRMVA